jgi:hypothetical protein
MRNARSVQDALTFITDYQSYKGSVREWCDLDTIQQIFRNQISAFNTHRVQYIGTLQTLVRQSRSHVSCCVVNTVKQSGRINERGD